MKRIQDSVHGLMEFRGMERVAVDVLSTPELQRLRRIRQLGLVNLVFPGAEHSRFTHSLGAAHVMKRFANALVTATGGYLPKSLQPDERVVRDMVVAALCHDLGHGPLSHAWEQHVVRGFSQQAWTRSLGLGEAPQENYHWFDTGQVWSWHEVVTQALLLGPTELHERLENIEAGMSKRVAGLLAGHFFFRYLAGAFASDVDADRCDFVLRDAFQTGVAHGRYDLDWLVSTIAVGADGDRPVLGFDLQKAPRVIEQLLIARRALYDTVYHHRAVRAAEGMVGLLLGRAQRTAAKNPDRAPIEGFEVFWRAIAGEPLTTREVLELDEDVLWVFIRRMADLTQPEDPSVARLADMVRRRDLFKPVPLNQTEIARLVLSSDVGEGSEAGNVVDRSLRDLGYDPPENFRFLDEAPFTFFHESPPGEGSWLIDLSGKERRASPVRTEPSLVHHDAVRRYVRLYVPADAVEAIRKAWPGQAFRQ